MYQDKKDGWISSTENVYFSISVLELRRINQREKNFAFDPKIEFFNGCIHQLPLTFSKLLRLNKQFRCDFKFEHFIVLKKII